MFIYESLSASVRANLELRGCAFASWCWWSQCVLFLVVATGPAKTDLWKSKWINHSEGMLAWCLQDVWEAERGDGCSSEMAERDVWRLTKGRKIRMRAFKLYMLAFPLNYEYGKKIYCHSYNKNCDESNLFITIRFSLNILCPIGQNDWLLYFGTSEFYSTVARMFFSRPKLSRSAVPL